MGIDISFGRGGWGGLKTLLRSIMRQIGAATSGSQNTFNIVHYSFTYLHETPNLTNWEFHYGLAGRSGGSRVPLHALNRTPVHLGIGELWGAIPIFSFVATILLY